MKPRFLFAIGFSLLLPAAARALTPAETAYFESKVRPILVQNCYKCHSQEATKLKGGLSVETKEALLTGGETGPALVPGDVAKSLLIKAIHYTDADLKMPPDNKKLTAEQIDTLEKWVKMGAPDPRLASAVKASGKSDKDHWAFKPVTSPPVPLTTRNADWVKNPVDSFVLSKLQANSMEPSPIADKRILIRRATYDLIGLPPTIEQTEDFLKDSSPEAFAKVVDRLLASPQYGERWGRYWLDVARYSDTKGEVKKQKEDPRNPYAWTYRDYVIKAFNEDKPFNQFIVEQLAADKIQLSNRQSIAALGFLTVGDHFNENRHDVINDQ
ncbi:MAG: hypothetical protein JWM04_1067, partial [Verrucomicrobiales bacterium]|nr:hypothetical protein [Verrucomicrobiales bacterium]